MDETETKSYVDLATSLHEKTIELDTRLKSLSSVNNALKGKLENSLSALRELCGNPIATRVTCGICYTRERTHAVLPCGHGGLCEQCAVRAVRRNRCHSCRATVENAVRIYL